jgi:hypothetical protein
MTFKTLTRRMIHCYISHPILSFYLEIHTLGVAIGVVFLAYTRMLAIYLPDLAIFFNTPVEGVVKDHR